MGRAAKPVGSTYQAGDYVFEKRVDGKWVKQHRLRMEKKLGRKLRANEHVHHKKGYSNKLSNLKLYSPSEHAKYHAAINSADPAERKRRSDRAKAQHAKGKLGRATWSKEIKDANDKRMQQLGSQSDAKHLKAHWKKPASRAKQSQQLRQHLAKNPGLRKAQAEARKKAGWWATHNQRVKLGEGRPKQKFAGK